MINGVTSIIRSIIGNVFKDILIWSIDWVIYGSIHFKMSIIATNFNTSRIESKLKYLNRASSNHDKIESSEYLSETAGAVSGLVSLSDFIQFKYEKLVPKHLVLIVGPKSRILKSNSG